MCGLCRPATVTSFWFGAIYVSPLGLFCLLWIGRDLILISYHCFSLSHFSLYILVSFLVFNDVTETIFVYPKSTWSLTNCPLPFPLLLLPMTGVCNYKGFKTRNCPIPSPNDWFVPLSQWLVCATIWALKQEIFPLKYPYIHMHNYKHTYTYISHLSHTHTHTAL